MIRFLFISILITVVIGCKTNPDAVLTEKINPIEYSMDNNAKLILEYPEISSISIGIYKDGKKYTKYYGEIDKGKGNKANDKSIFEIASVTKTFTAYLTAQAVLDGKLKLDDDIRKYIEGSYTNLEFNNRPIFIKDILTHTTGIERKQFSEILAKMFSIDVTNEERKEIKEYGTADFVDDLKKYQLEVTPGEKYNYSGFVAPEILALILEQVYQTTYNELLEEFILKEAQMSQTLMNVNLEDKKYVLNGYTTNNRLVEPMQMPLTGAGGGLKSTVPDLLKYIEFLLEKDNPVVKEMQKPLFFDEEEGDQYGYFWMLGDDNIMMHNGGTGGSVNWLILIPESNSGFTVSFNYNGDMANDLINYIASSIVDDIINYPQKNAYFIVRDAIRENPDNWKKIYKKIKEETKEEYDFDDPNMLNSLGYELMGQDKIEEAIEVLELLVSEFPELSNPYDSLGEAYFMNKQYDLSLVNYKKSLELNPKNDNAVEMIEKIKTIKKN
ncbi:serine hydrolase [Aquimarina sp. D1M17]|uniref:serine hydrolase n=1 Tax=Aquimarina acroporae TaxID=2937283 RepID=UPI0020BE8522|nr:serine hydrolase [Aquimarina acroporae]MCK8522218.1 serine hydrolase [Aquimarina acroporae]